MLRRQIIALSVLCFFSLSLAFADEGDYLMGLNAYRDGLNDIAKIGFETYLADTPDDANKPYAEYLMYILHLSDGEFDKSYEYFKKIEKIDDKRFDKNRIEGDKMRFLVREDCLSARTELLSNTSSAGSAVFVSSQCELDNETAKAVAESVKDSSILLNAAVKVQGDPELSSIIFKSLDLKQLTSEQIKYFAILFYKNENFDNFWKLYDVNKDNDMVNMALERLWNIKNYEGFCTSFEANRKSFTFSSTTYCRAIEAYKELNTEFDCDLFDNCIKERNASFAKAKTACLITNHKTDDVDKLLDIIDSSALSGICDYMPYMIDKDLYWGKKMGSFSNCVNKFDIAELLNRKKRFTELTELVSKGTDDKSYYYSALGYLGIGNRVKAAEFASKVSDEELKAYLSGRLQ